MELEELKKLSGMKDQVTEGFDPHQISALVNAAVDLYNSFGLQQKEHKLLIFVAAYLLFAAGRQFESIVFGIVRLIFGKDRADSARVFNLMKKAIEISPEAAKRHAEKVKNDPDFF